MIPSDWTPVHRADGEHVGYLAPDGAPGLVHALLLTGTRAAGALAPQDAQKLLRERGLAAMDRRWWCRLPDAPLSGVLPAGSPAPHWSWQPVVLVEVSPAGATVRSEFGGTGRAALPVPVGDLLVTDPPE